jgi:hypothetical protein
MRFILGILLLFVTSMASANIVFSPSFSYMAEEQENAGVTTSEYTKSFYDFRLGYLSASGLYLGGIYSMSSYDQGYNQKGFAVGPTVGYKHYAGFFALFSYYLMAELKVDATSTLTDGMGPQVDIGWAFPLTSSFHIGPQITYRSITFDKIDPGAVAVEITQTDLVPAINLWFNF